MVPSKTTCISKTNSISPKLKQQVKITLEKDDLFVGFDFVISFFVSQDFMYRVFHPNFRSN